MAGHGVSRPSFSITIFCLRLPDGVALSVMATTLPDTLACTGHPSPLSGISPIFCPIVTVSPTCTIGLQGAPMCWDRGMDTVLGGVKTSIRQRLVFLYSST